MFLQVTLHEEVFITSGTHMLFFRVMTNQVNVMITGKGKLFLTLWARILQLLVYIGMTFEGARCVEAKGTYFTLHWLMVVLKMPIEVSHHTEIEVAWFAWIISLSFLGLCLLSFFYSKSYSIKLAFWSRMWQCMWFGCNITVTFWWCYHDSGFAVTAAS